MSYWLGLSYVNMMAHRRKVYWFDFLMKNDPYTNRDAVPTRMLMIPESPPYTFGEWLDIDSYLVVPR